MDLETARLLNRIAVGLGLAATLWAHIAAGIEKKKLAKVTPQPSGWTESYLQTVIRYLTKKQKIAFVILVGSACVMAVIVAALTE